MSLFEDLQVLNKIIDKPLNKIAKETNLTLNEVRVLLFLYENEKFDIASDIVENLMISKAHVSVSVETLVNKQYLERIQDDKNKKKFHLKITGNSKKILDLLDVEIDKLKKDLTKDISEEDEEIFKKTLKKIIQNTKELTQKKEESIK